ncbi:MAG TPA: hypothetical protein VGY66_11760 [Gemmataceae bacterium]|jgi:hypothetical protein|nr:hypothetical protein [Gemmataceae bacterium]
MNCPKCRSQIPAEDVNLDTLFAKCRYCNEVFRFADSVPQAAQAEPYPVSGAVE